MSTPDVTSHLADIEARLGDLKPLLKKWKTALTKKRNYEANKEKILATNKAYREANKAAISATSKRYRENNIEAVAAQQGAWVASNKEHINANSRRKYAEDPERHLEYSRNYVKENPEKRALTNKQYRERNPEWYANSNKLNNARYSENNPAAIAMRRMIERLQENLNSTDKKAVEAALGYTAENLYRHIENQFVDGMCWARRSEIHFDHIKPIAVFIEEGITDPAIVHALSNLRPMWAKENQSKGAKYDREKDLPVPVCESVYAD